MTTQTLTQTSAPYADALAAEADRPWLRLNVPGHSADEAAISGMSTLLGPDQLRLDIPPLTPGIDLGVNTPLEQAHRLAAEAWGARRTWLLTNGASQANRIATLALGVLGRRVVVQRSVHSSVIDGLVLAGITPSFVMPSVDYDLGIAHGVTAYDLERALAANPDAVAAYVVTPSYFGAVADVRELAEVAHAAGVALIADEAWGAHFGFHPRLPENALAQGADLVISSTHKLGGSLTQSAMLHLGHGPHALELEPHIVRTLRMTQSTSESALLLGSLDLARRSLATGHDRIARSIAAADAIRQAVRADGRFGIVSDGFGEFPDIVAADPLRIPIDTRAGGISGHDARWMLREQHQVLVEVSTDSAIVAVIGAGSSPDPERFLTALQSLPATLADDRPAERLKLPAPGELKVTPREAFFSPSTVVAAHRAIGRVSAATLAAYPPGIPNVLPGEVITEELVSFLQATAATPGGHVRGAEDAGVATLRVLSR